MRKDTPYIIIVLILISNGNPLNSSYKLMQFIERKLKIIESDKILEKIRLEGYASFDIVKGIHCYNLTHLGKKFIDKEYDNARSFLIERYPSENEIIATLFDTYKND